MTYGTLHTKGKTWRLLLGIKIKSSGNPLAVQWLGLSAFTAKTWFNPWLGTKILQDVQCGQKKKKKEKNYVNKKLKKNQIIIDHIKQYSWGP